MPLKKYIPSFVSRHTRHFTLYTLIGAFSAFCDWLLFVVLYAVFKTPVVNFISYAVGTLISFFLNARVNFQVFDKMGARLVNFLTIAAIGAVTSTTLIYLLTAINISPAIAKILTLPLVLILQYTLNRKFSFG